MLILPPLGSNVKTPARMRSDAVIVQARLASPHDNGHPLIADQRLSCSCRAFFARQRAGNSFVPKRGFDTTGQRKSVLVPVPDATPFSIRRVVVNQAKEIRWRSNPVRSFQI